ncbi:Type 1 glutamine amidotransferase-like domain-containing protein [Patescibacteria group bacterium]|jgi:dipeptidase E|nr:Type 1 glutamine amidotransferase-like domain-containing protein [Patescibacteria group bacterium]
MRLYLSSYKLGNQPERFAQLVRENKRVAVIANSRDAFSDVRRGVSIQTEIEALQRIGLVGNELDLRMYIGKKEALTKELSTYGAVWILGGNAFVLRRVMADCGFDEAIKDLLKKDAFVYAGYSAAAVVLAPTLRGVEKVDPPSDVSDVLKAEILWQGLDVLPYMVVPHYKSDHPESALIDEMVEFLEKERLPYKTIQDGQAVWVDGDVEGIIG